MKRARATIEARKGRVNGLMSGRLRQPVVRSDQLQADLVLEDVRRRISLDVQRPPERDPHGRVLGCDFRL